MRLWKLRFSYPRTQFPEDVPDGVWHTNITDIVVPDKRLVRKPVGVESRSRKPGTVEVLELFAREQSDTGKQVIGELHGLGEVVSERNGNVEYQLFGIHIMGAYDREKSEWSLVSKSIGPAGSTPGER